jgi:hypothetical protein
LGLGLHSLAGKLCLSYSTKQLIIRKAILLMRSARDSSIQTFSNDKQASANTRGARLMKLPTLHQ